MGTRHVTFVVQDGKYKVAQYGQWDGYPSGQGITVRDFVSLLQETVYYDTFSEKVKKLSFLTGNGADELYRSVGIDPSSEFITGEEKKRFDDKYPHLSRDTGADVLSQILNSTKPLKLQDSTDFAHDSLFCEYGYVIDLDERVFEVYVGHNREPDEPDARFYKSVEDHKAELPPYRADLEYYSIKKVIEWGFDDIPSEDEFSNVVNLAIDEASPDNQGEAA